MHPPRICFGVTSRRGIYSGREGALFSSFWKPSLRSLLFRVRSGLGPLVQPGTARFRSALFRRIESLLTVRFLASLLLSVFLQTNVVCFCKKKKSHFLFKEQITFDFERRDSFS